MCQSMAHSFGRRGKRDEGRTGGVTLRGHASARLRDVEKETGNQDFGREASNPIEK